MKKKLLNALLGALIIALLLALVSCVNTAPKCPPHQDLDGDGRCDECSEVLNPDVDPGDKPGNDPGDEPGDDPGDDPVIMPDLSGITLENKTVSYNGDEYSIDITGELPEGVRVEYDGGNVTDAGVYTVSAKFFYQGEEIPDSSLEATLTIEKASFDTSLITLSESSAIYNCIKKNPTALGELPYGVSVSYSYENEAGDEVEEIIYAGWVKNCIR